MNPQSAVVSYAERLAQVTRSRHRALEAVLTPPLFSLTSLMGPISDGPDWPSDASWLAARHDDCVCIISDGLADPWVEEDRPSTGLGLEVLVETPELDFPDEAPLVITDTWLFPMTAELSHTLAKYPRLCNKLLTGEPLSLRFNIEHIKDGRGLVGALLHQPPHLPDLQTIAGTVAIVAATLLTSAELRWLAGRGEDGRRELLAKLYEAGIGSRSLAGRKSVVKA